MKQEIENFLQKNMSRKDFLRHVGLLLLTVVGLGNLLKYLAGNGINPITKFSSGYGSNLYGGKDRHRRG